MARLSRTNRHSSVEPCLRSARDASPSSRRSSHRACPRDERGAVYVEFLIAFIPVFILVLGICQLAFVASAKAVVEHAAWAAARSAIVVLEDDFERYGGIPRGDATVTTTEFVPGIGELMAVLQIDSGEVAKGGAVETGSLAQYAQSRVANLNAITQRAAKSLNVSAELPSRMTTIRAAAYLPLLPLAKTDTDGGNESVEGAIHDDFFSRMASALDYTRAAAAVTLHTARDNEVVAKAAFAADAEITARVIYLYSCDVPVVRQIMCRSGESIRDTSDRTLKDALGEVESTGQLQSMLSAGGRYTVLIGKATLVNQGAAYEPRLPEGEEGEGDNDGED